MIITKIQDGLGNQMFQYALGKNLALLNKIQLKLDISFYNQIKEEKSGIKKYKLNFFNIVENIAEKKDLEKIKVPDMNSMNFASRLKRKFFKYRESKKKLEYKKYIKQSVFNFDPNILKLKNNIYIDGSWQTEKYFKNIENIIRKEFTLKNKLSNAGKNFLNIIKNTNSISIHVRRGDYMSNRKFKNYYGVCSSKYYKATIKKITNLKRNPHFFIFSDDVDWAKNNLKINFPLIFISGNNIQGYEEMILMSFCQHNIIANSTFSWWGAWLNNNPNKIVYAPKKWLNNSPHNTNDLCPESWLRI